MKILAALALIQVVTGAAIVSKRAKCGSFCIDSYEPVCGSDGITYSNLCFFNIALCMDTTNALTMSHKGPCGGGRRAASCPMFCASIWAPVCGSDGKTYSNTCSLEIAKCKIHDSSLTKVSTGACADDLLLSK